MILYPYADATGEAESQINENASPEGLTVMTVLIVEDNELNMEIAEYMATEAGARGVKAFDGRQASC